MSKIIANLLTANGGDSGSLITGFTILSTVLDTAGVKDTMLYLQSECNADLTAATYTDILANQGNKDAQVFLLQVEDLNLQPDELEISLMGNLINQLSPKKSTGNAIVDAMLSSASYCKAQAASNHNSKAVELANEDYKNIVLAVNTARKSSGQPELTADELKQIQAVCKPKHYVCLILRNGLSAKFASFAPKQGAFSPSNISGLISATFTSSSKQAPKENGGSSKRTSNIFVA